MTLKITLSESQLKKADTLAREWAQGEGYTVDSSLIRKRTALTEETIHDLKGVGTP